MPRSVRLARLLLPLLCGLLLFIAGPTWEAEKVMTTPLLSDTDFSAQACAWQPEAAREEIQPPCAVDAKVSRNGTGGSLRSACTAATQYGGWTRTVSGLTGEQWYRFDAYYRAQGVKEEGRCVVARLDWRRSDGRRAAQPDYVYRIEDAGGGWKHIWTTAPAPHRATAVKLELLMGWSPGGTVWWDEIGFAPAPAPAPRKVRVATIHRYPHGTYSSETNLREFEAMVDRAAESKPDIICLPEAMASVGTHFSYADVAEPIPGPISERFGAQAKKYHCYIIACYNERDGAAIYNTAVLINREGQVAGKYRKAYVPREEIEGGVTPGDEAAVFDTDFGRIGMMICWDVQCPEPAQRMALKGAEIIFEPVWAGNPILTQARAIENHVYLVTCEYDNPSRIYDPEGQLLAEATDEKGSVAVADLDLSQRPYYSEWLGDMRARLHKEHRDLR